MRESVQDYYGQQLQSSADLQTNACCDPAAMPEWLKPLLSRIHPEVLSKYYGCGLVCPEALTGCRILDLGSGSGRDVYALAQVVGATGEVVGVDMTKEQLAVAESYQNYHSDLFGYSNVHFLEGYIENLEQLDLEPASFDIVVSNCVINLAEDKGAVLAGVKRLLKPGGEMYFADVYADRRVPESLQKDPVVYGECLGGALYWNDFLRIAKASGFIDPRLVTSRQLTLENPELQARLGHIQFHSATWRLFNLDRLEDACEDYGQAVIYRGTLPNHPDAFALDGHHLIETGKVFPVCGNTWAMLHDTRFRDHFDFIGDFSRHFGIFEGCGTAMPFTTEENGNIPCC